MIHGPLNGIRKWNLAKILGLFSSQYSTFWQILLFFTTIVWWLFCRSPLPLDPSAQYLLDSHKKTVFNSIIKSLYITHVFTICCFEGQFHTHDCYSTENSRILAADPGFLRQGNPWVRGKTVLFGKIFTKNCMKIKEIGSRGGACP